MGWFGQPEQLEWALRAAGADRDEEGRYMIYGEPVIRGLDGDVVVGDGCQYSVGGRRASL